jgi:hypothetical protein
VSREIILMRHGQPKLVATDKMSALGMKDWIEQYNRSEFTNPSGCITPLGVNVELGPKRSPP